MSTCSNTKKMEMKMKKKNKKKKNLKRDIYLSLIYLVDDYIENEKN